MKDTEISTNTAPQKTAIEWVAEAVEADLALIPSIEGYTTKKLYAALFNAVNASIKECQTIAFVAKNRNEFYHVNAKYIMILSMYQEMLNVMLPDLKEIDFEETYVLQNQQLFVIMISKLFMLIKRADIYFENPVHYREFKEMLPVQMFIDNVVKPKQEEEAKKEKKS